jgi:polynucleotide kinase-phosphatase
MHINIPNLSLVVLIGPSGSGKSTFARRHFLPTEVLCSDQFRGMVSDDENDQAATKDAFDLLHYAAEKRLARGRLTVVDATNVQPEARAPLVQIARKHHCLPVAIVLNLPEKVCQERNRDRDDRMFGPHVVQQQRSQLRRSLKRLKREGFRHVFILESVEEVESATVERVPLWNDRREEHGPFDIIGDVHGCADELEELLENLGYEQVSLAALGNGWGEVAYRHPAGRKAVFVGDLVDRGPRILDSVRIVRNMVAHGGALCVPGNHDMKLLKKLRGKNVQITHGLANSLAEIDALPEEVREPFCREMAEFFDSLVSHYVLDDGKLVVAHAGMKESMQGRGSRKVRDFALYGETTGETDEFGLPQIRQSPTDDGLLKAIVIRPATDERVSLTECEISPELGVHGDNWADGCWMSLPDGRPHPDVQVAIMNARTIALIAREESRWPLAGDNLYVDLDLGRDNLPCGQQLAVGSAVLEITAVAHCGCRKFADRYGSDAVRFVNSEIGETLRLRGVYARILQTGVIRVGDVIRKL